MSDRILAKFFSKVRETGKYHRGAREVIKNLKDSKLVVVSSSLSKKELDAIERVCEERTIPLIKYEDNSMKLGKICGKPFKIKAISVRHPGEASIRKLLKSLKR